MRSYFPSHGNGTYDAMGRRPAGAPMPSYFPSRWSGKYDHWEVEA